MSTPIILASQSPRRKQLLEWADVDFTIQVVPTEEAINPLLPIEDIPIAIAKEKAFAVQTDQNKESIIIAADTIVVVDGQILGKPIDEEHAIEMLMRLQGNQHQVMTGVYMLWGAEVHAFVDVTHVWFNALSRDQLAFYVEKYKPFDKAGAYAIQEWIGVVGIQKIEGDFYNVMGLPVNRVMQQLAVWQSK